MEVIRFESEGYKGVVGKIEKMGGYVGEGEVGWEEKKEGWVERKEVGEGLGMSRGRLEGVRDEKVMR